ncbi:heparinase II/III domain-containing protein [Phycisphaera mikurensis]|uniref:Heparinase II/III-like C-terminal domain-containing protein n=1 Tax=Phycisphaera mikurensis (strain NBRC 102666 / KCTC 22515 / FYK2301M01) TaxID=1142394 RepID=I0IDV2_PHYMF|nr:heparinase II/III family protein [Phycisphaera mikurensis]MBB6441250.1 hypothetical protein [Phycisphaera mikurensis]BAM03440.1 hypothetical protein PSMK_12810 [Phycisphaera mikurensis NBRC 102666]
MPTSADPAAPGPPPPSPPLASMPEVRAGHPRVIATPERLAALRAQRAGDAVLDALLRNVEARARACLDQPTLQREQVGRRLLRVSREALERITACALAFHTTGDGRFARRAEEELLAVAGFTDWNPTHFLDTAEMAAAVGLGYDWLFDTLSDDTRVALRGALQTKALRQRTASRHGWHWQLATHNWNPVGFGGLTLAALAIAEDDPAALAELLAAVREHNPRALQAMAPDGVHPEGPAYWSYGTTYQCLLLDALRTALGTDLGLAQEPGFLASGGFMAHARGPTGRSFNFSDSRERVSFTPAFLWVAEEANAPGWLAAWRAGGWEEATAADGRFRVFTPLWWLRLDPTALGEDAPRSWSGGGPNPVAFFRERWSDPGAMYLAIKGGRGSVSHGHLDAGSFVLDADGVRWAMDPGKVDYESIESQGIDLWDRAQGSDRWRVYHHRNEAHNTLTIGGALHRVDGFAPLIAVEPLAPPGENLPGVAALDLAAPLGASVATATRRFVFDPGPDRGVTVTDELTGLAPAAREEPVAWTLMTEAAVEVDGDSATLRRDGKMLRVEMTSSRAGRWHAEPAAPPAGLLGPPLPGVTRLRWTTSAAPDGTLRLEATLRPLDPLR